MCADVGSRDTTAQHLGAAEKKKVWFKENGQSRVGNRKEHHE